MAATYPWFLRMDSLDDLYSPLLLLCGLLAGFRTFYRAWGLASGLAMTAVFTFTS
jgi:hypothetical protein